MAVKAKEGWDALDSYTRHIKRYSNVLDLGCGTGSLTKALLDKVGLEGRVVAIDPDGERIQIANMTWSVTYCLEGFDT